jgi:hypothetical protein
METDKLTITVNSKDQVLINCNLEVAKTIHDALSVIHDEDRDLHHLISPLAAVIDNYDWRV